MRILTKLVKMMKKTNTMTGGHTHALPKAVYRLESSWTWAFTFSPRKSKNPKTYLGNESLCISEKILAWASSKMSLGGSSFFLIRFCFTFESRLTWSHKSFTDLIFKIMQLFGQEKRPSDYHLCLYLWKSCVIDVDLENYINVLSENLFPSLKTFQLLYSSPELDIFAAELLFEKLLEKPPTLSTLQQWLKPSVPVIPGSYLIRANMGICVV